MKVDKRRKKKKAEEAAALTDDLFAEEVRITAVMPHAEPHDISPGMPLRAPTNCCAGEVHVLCCMRGRILRVVPCMLSNLHGSQPAHRCKICMCCHVWRMRCGRMAPESFCLAGRRRRV